MQKNTFDTYTFGCRVNQAETEQISLSLVSNGFVKVNKNPHMYVINTCAVTQKSEREAKQLIYQLRRKLPKTKLFVIGCAATKWLNENKKPIEVDYLIDNNNKEYITDLIKKNIKFNSLISKSQAEIQNLNNFIKYDKYLKSKRVFVKIQDGCQRFCTFCIVPYLRGKPKSKKISKIVSEINKLQKNFTEVILTAINTQAFGFDSNENFTSLFESVLKKTKIPRISFGSIHPWSIDDVFLKTYNKLKYNQNFVNFFHIPLQSGSDRILKLMNRGYTAFEFSVKLKQLDKIRPLSFFGTDIITGFLDETDKDFEETYEFLANSPIVKFHIFRYSKREKTAAFYMSKKYQLPNSATVKKRSQALIDLGQNKYQKFLHSCIGYYFDALILNNSKNQIAAGLLSNQLPVIINNTNRLAGEIVKIRVKSVKKESLISSIV
jgi:threonylcarbamoyladenosine tRNA methylthiotransferase MtaB